MRLPARSAVLVLAAAAYLAIGPYALVAVAVLLVAGLVASQRIRRGLRPTWKTSGIFVVLAAAVALVVALIPDGRLPIPPGGGMLVTASYVGSPAEPRPIDLSIPQHPGLAVNGSSSMHNDGWATDAYAGPGPLGVDPEVDTAWYGIKECATLAFDRHGRIVALCGSVRGAIMHVLDPESMDPLVTVKLPGRTSASEKKPWQDLCGGAYFYLGADDRAYVETTTRQIRVFETATADGEPALDQVEVLDLSGVVPEDDCLLSLMPDWQGRGIWFATQDGRVGLAELGGEPQVLELGAGIANSMAADLTGLYVVTDGDFFKLDVGEDGSPEIVWSAAYDNSGVDKTGQLSPGSGTTPTVLPNGLVAITDNAEPRMNVVFYDATDGSKVCQEPVFGEGESSTDNSLVAVGSASVVVENNFGNDSP
ncbi:hypothetical protein, partial [Nocardioides sp.]|uniref:hypothetical protein n=1 Tax=Nocardioides sp. TaxID=35761 RepID=UPI00356654EC